MGVAAAIYALQRQRRQRSDRMSTLPTADDTPTPVAEPVEVQTDDEVIILNWILSLPDPEEESELADL